MELYYSPFACSLASHITLREAGLDADLVAVRLATKKTSAGRSLLDVSKKGWTAVCSHTRPAAMNGSQNGKSRRCVPGATASKSAGWKTEMLP